MNVQDVVSGKGAAILALANDRTLEDAVTMMAQHNVGSLAVVDAKDHALGIITEPDIVAAIARGGSPSLLRGVSHAMRTPAPVCDADTHVAHAMALMTRARVRYLLVERHGRTVGIVSIGDLVKARLESAELESRVLRDIARGAVLARA